MRKLLMLVFIVCLSGCTFFTKTVYVPHGQSVRLRETVKKVDVWVITKDGEIVPGNLDLPDGWYCLPDPGEK